MLKDMMDVWMVENVHMTGSAMCGARRRQDEGERRVVQREEKQPSHQKAHRNANTR